MAGNTDPIYSRVGDIQWATPSATQNQAFDGTGTVATVFTADATNGGFVSYVKAKPLGTAVVSSLRIFLNNGSTNATAANNTLIGEVTLPAVTIAQNAANAEVMYPLNIALPAGYKINVAITTTVAASWAVTAVGGKF
jgi:hypothetical protein